MAAQVSVMSRKRVKEIKNKLEGTLKPISFPPSTYPRLLQAPSKNYPVPEDGTGDTPALVTSVLRMSALKC